MIFVFGDQNMTEAYTLAYALSDTIPESLSFVVVVRITFACILNGLYYKISNKASWSENLISKLFPEYEIILHLFGKLDYKFS